jgi:hypothetical protein
MVLLELQKKTGLWWNPDLINKCLMEFYIYLVILIRLISLQWPRIRSGFHQRPVFFCSSNRTMFEVNPGSFLIKFEDLNKFNFFLLHAHSSKRTIWNVHGLNQSWGTCMGVDDLWNGQTILHGLNQGEVHIWGDWWSVKWTDNYCCSLRLINLIKITK